MIKHFFGDYKNFTLTLIASLICSIMLTVVFWAITSFHQSSTLNEIDKLKLEVEKKTSDRYHGSDARRDQEALHKHLDMAIQECSK